MNENKLLNESAQREEIRILNSIIDYCKDKDLAGTLYNLKSELENQPSSDSDKLYLIDKNIQTVLEDINKDVIKNSYNSVSLKVDKLQELIGERKMHCRGVVRLTKKEEKARKKGCSVASLYTAEELAEILLRSMQDEREKLITKQAAYLKKGDGVSVGLANKVEIQIKTVEKRINLYLNEGERTALIEGVKALDTEYKEMILKRDPEASDAAFNAAMQKFEELQQKIDEDYAETEKAKDKFYGVNKAGTNASASGVNGTYSAYNHDESYTSNGRTYTALGGKALKDPQAEILKSLENVDAIIATLENSISMYDDEINEKSRDIARVEDRLRNLLSERDGANASEREGLDNKINNNLGERDALIKTRKRLMRAQNEVQDERKLYINLKSVNDVERVKQIVQSQTGRSMGDLQELAMYLKQYDERANAARDEMEAVNDVANSAEINTKALPNDVSEYVSDYESDDHKYDRLKKELGL